MMQTELVWLLGAVGRGDEAAFERLYDATRAKLYGVLVRILGKLADKGYSGALSVELFLPEFTQGDPAHDDRTLIVARVV